MKSKSEFGYCFGEQEPFPDGARRILCEQLTHAITALSGHQRSLEEAVHEARRCLKRTRSLLRLVRFAIPVTYTVETRRLQHVGRSLSELRDSHALAGTLRDLEKHGRQERSGKSDPIFASVQELLRKREKQASKEIAQNKGLESSIAQLREAGEKICRLSFRRVGLKGVLKSVRKCVKQGKKAFAAAKSDPKPEKFHDWRKRAKNLRYHLAVLSELRPDLGHYSNSAKKLEQLLGDDHNLAVLADLLTEAQPPKADAHPLQEIIAHRQSKLRAKAKELGEQIYGGKFRVWKERLMASGAHA